MDPTPGLAPPRITATTLREFGYRYQEARFLYLAATHSGYFTRHQFLWFTHQTKGCLVHRFTSKLLTQNHAQATQYGHKTYVFKLTSRKIYEPIGKENLRDHRSHTADFIRTRLLILDFVLAHPDHLYLETDVEKIRFFHEQLGISARLFPEQNTRTADPHPTLTRYFKDRFPIFVSQRNDGGPFSAAPAFVYCDPPNHDSSWFASYLDRHQIFFRWLPAFNLIYASPSAGKLDRASRVFTALFKNTNRPDLVNLARYFQIRRLWEKGETGSLTRADRDLLRAGDKQYRVQPLESAYQKWFADDLQEVDLDVLLGPCFHLQEVGFQTFLLPDNHDFMCCPNAHSVRPSPKNAESTLRSASRSTGTALQVFAAPQLRSQSQE